MHRRPNLWHDDANDIEIAEIDRILAMSDDELLSECRAQGEDPAVVAESIRKELLEWANGADVSGSPVVPVNGAGFAVSRPSEQDSGTSLAAGWIVWQRSGAVTRLWSVNLSRVSLAAGTAALAVCGVITAERFAVLSLDFWRSLSAGHTLAGAASVARTEHNVQATPASNAPYDEAVAFMRAKQYDRAIQGFTKAIESNPKSVAAYYNRAVCRMNRSDHRAAIADFTSVLSLDRGNLKARYNRGVSYMNTDNPESAVEDFTAVIQQSPSKSAYRNRGRAKVALGDLAGADADFAQANRQPASR